MEEKGDEQKSKRKAAVLSTLSDVAVQALDQHVYIDCYKVHLYLLSFIVLPISCAFRMQNILCGGTPSHFSCDKGVVQCIRHACAFWVGSFTYKTDRPICLGTGCRNKVHIPSLERGDARCGALHRERLTTNTKHDSSVHVSERNC